MRPCAEIGGNGVDRPSARQRLGSAAGAYAAGVLGVAVCTGVAWAMHGHFDLSNLIMVYLLGVVAVTTRFGRGPAVLASLLSVTAFDFCFVPPRGTLAVSDTQYLVTFAVMLVVALVISALTDRVSPPSRGGSRRLGTRGGGVHAEHAAFQRLPRSADAARRHHRGRQLAGRGRGLARPPKLAASWPLRSTMNRSGWSGSSTTCWT